MVTRLRNHTLNLLVVVATILSMAGLTQGCGGDKGESKSKRTTAAKRERAQDYHVYGSLPKVLTRDIYLPFLMGTDGLEEKPCLKSIDVGKLSVSEHDVMGKQLVDENQADMARTIREWFVSDLGPMGLSDEMAGAWTVTAEDVVVVKAPGSELRFAEDQQCIDTSGRLPEGVHVVTELYGARIFKFETTLPLEYDVQQEMLRVVLMENMNLESDVFFVFEPAVDGQGQPMKNLKEELLYVAPDGTHIPEKEVPSPENRMMKEWILKSETPIFFGFRELPEQAWQRESQKEHCDVFLVWGDKTPRAPECSEFQEALFTADKTDSGVLLTIKVGQDTRKEEFAFDAARMLQISDRIILWISPKEVEEGLKVRINSLVLNPEAVSEGGGSSYVVPSKSKPHDDQEKPSKTGKAEKQKKAKASDDDAVDIDDYLNQ